MSLLDTLSEHNALLHVTAAGCGANLLSELQGQPGCSAHLIGSEFPYAAGASVAAAGKAPGTSFVSWMFAHDLAAASYLKACEAKQKGSLEGEPVGLGVTASIASKSLPRGDQRVHIVAIAAGCVVPVENVFCKMTGFFARLQQDMWITRAACGAIEHALERQDKSDDLQALSVFYEAPLFSADGTRRPASTNGLYVPATLNPLHDGHRLLAQAAEEHTGRRATYLVSSESPHKPSLRIQDILQRAAMVRRDRWNGAARSVEFTRDEPLFLDKARKRPGSTFVIGADTMIRMLDPKWGPEVEPMLQELANLETRFLVMGRVIDGNWTTCRDVAVPWSRQTLFEPLQGRADVSSTELRGAL